MIITVKFPMDVDGLDSMFAMESDLAECLKPHAIISDSGFGSGARDLGIQTENEEWTKAQLRRFFDRGKVQVLMGVREEVA